MTDLISLKAELKQQQKKFHELDYQNELDKDKMVTLYQNLEKAKVYGETNENFEKLEAEIREAEDTYDASIEKVQAKYFVIDELKLKIHNLEEEDET